MSSHVRSRSNFELNLSKSNYLISDSRCKSSVPLRGKNLKSRLPPFRPIDDGIFLSREQRSRTIPKSGWKICFQDSNTGLRARVRRVT